MEYNRIRKQDTRFHRDPAYFTKGSLGWWEEHELWGQMAQVQIPVLLPKRCVVLGRLFNLSGLQFSTSVKRR